MECTFSSGGTPSLMFVTDKLDELYENFTNKQVTVGELVSMPSGRVFNFADPEGNYFAVMENHVSNTQG